MSWRTCAEYNSWGTAPDEAVDGGATGTGIKLLAGVVWLQEIRDGEIPHALAFASRLSCADDFRYRAIKTDGDVDDGTRVPQGSRLQLDPTVDVRSISGITPREVTAAEALQTHGGHVRDVSRSAGRSLRGPRQGVDNPYPEVEGFPWDYHDKPHIPWDRLRVLGQGTASSGSPDRVIGEHPAW